MTKISLRAYDREIEVLIEQGQHSEEVIAHCRRILELYPRHLDTLRLLGKAHVEAKRYEPAADSFERVLESAPEDFVSHVGLSVIADATGKLDEAIWHMERAFEAQPSNAAIQGELQRLFGRRDGVEPPKIRLTRGALAHMYVQGELYSQAISEARGVLQTDPKRSDMQCLLARAYFRSGQQTEAIQVCTELIGAYPYCLDASRLMAQMLKSSGQERLAEPFCQRLNELDPYAAFATESVLETAAVPDSAVTLDRWDYSGSQLEVGAGGQLEPVSKPSGEAHDASAPSWLAGGASQPGIHARRAQATDDIPPFLRGPNQIDRRIHLEDGPTRDATALESLPGELADRMAPRMKPVPSAGDGAGARAVAAQGDPPRWLRRFGGSRSPVGDFLAIGAESSAIPGSASSGPREDDDADASRGDLSAEHGRDPEPLLGSLEGREGTETSPEQQRTPSHDDPAATRVESYLEARSADEPAEAGADSTVHDLAFDFGNDVNAVDDSEGEVPEVENTQTSIVEELDAPDWLLEADTAGIEPPVSDEVPESRLQFDTMIDDPDPYNGVDAVRAGTPEGVGSPGEMPLWLRPEVEPKPQSTTARRASDWRPLEPDEWAGTDDSGMEGEVEGLIASEGSDPEPGARPEAADLPADQGALPSGARPKAMEPGPRGEEVASLGVAQSALGRGNIAAALDAYGQLIRKGKSLDEIIRDLRDALYRYPVEVPIWQALGDAYMRANRVQEALDAYTRAEELLR